MRDNCTMKLSPRVTCWAAALILAWAGAAAPAVAASQADRAFGRAQKALEKGDYDAAIAALDEAVRLEPKQAKFRGVRGLAWLRKGDYARGTADLKAAIELNPGDAGLRYQPSSSARLSAEAMEHGRRQVAQMLHDRPAMAEFEKDAGFLRDWAARKFAGEDFGELIDWDPSPPLHSDAEHLAAGDGQHAAILVEALYTAGPNADMPRSFEELWAGAVYELHNVALSREFVRLNDQAEEGKVSKEAFVAGILKFELLAAQRTRAFYVRVFLPWAEKKKLPTNPSLWFCDWWDSPEGRWQTFPTSRPIPGGLMRGRTTGPPSIATGATDNTTRPENSCSGCGARRATKRSSRTCRTGSDVVWPDSTSRPTPWPLSAKRFDWTPRAPPPTAPAADNTKSWARKPRPRPMRIRQESWKNRNTNPH